MNNNIINYNYFVESQSLQRFLTHVNTCPARISQKKETRGLHVFCSVSTHFLSECIAITILAPHCLQATGTKFITRKILFTFRYRLYLVNTGSPKF